MTTTLRPTGPEERGPDAARVRSYAIHVNGRTVGGLRLATVPGDLPAGRVEDLRVDPAERGRGRATVAALAAEEILRDWGCRHLLAEIPPGASAAHRLAGALGYTERNRHLVKELAAPPALPPGSVARPLAAASFDAWLATARAEYVEVWSRQGLTPAEAAAKSDADHAAALPDGPATARTALRVLAHRGTDVGTLWLHLGAADAPRGYVYAVRVDPGHRGHGHGRSLMLLAERECLAAGARALRLNVFTDNAPALGLYASLGYTAAAHHYVKPLW
ncbi:GNAT family N-acetyltransferase [Streptomyces sp. TRM70308]|uniref:GNAT family N-acetyltransferase n=1 Tax=Streptomyces sp. TRM70308 TaxID=3131932 RepID=UPI003D028879